MDRNLYFELHRRFNEERQYLLPRFRIVFDELSLMAVLQQQTCLSVSELAKAQLVGSPTESRRACRLEEAGFVALFHPPCDRRLTHCCLTPFGQTSLMAFMREFHRGFPRGSSFERACPETASLVPVVASMGRVPMPADNLILFCYVMRSCESMTVSDIVELTGLQEGTVSMALRRMEQDGTMQVVSSSRSALSRPHCRLAQRNITHYGQRCGHELLRLVAEL